LPASQPFPPNEGTTAGVSHGTSIWPLNSGRLLRPLAGLLLGWIDSYLLTTSTNAALLVYQAPRTMMNFKFTYNLSHRTSLYFNADNLLCTPLNSRYYVFEDRVGFTRLPFRSVAAGIQFRF
jgi:hypothetical protein